MFVKANKFGLSGHHPNKVYFFAAATGQVGAERAMAVFRGVPGKPAVCKAERSRLESRRTDLECARPLEIANRRKRPARPASRAI